MRKGKEMSNNPNTIESQESLNPCNEGKRSSEVLLQTIEKCERLQKQLDIAKEILQEFADDGYFSANKALLEIEELNK
jgi:DNA-directed RNA polymerase specialized sigma54-like protein